MKRTGVLLRLSACLVLAQAVLLVSFAAADYPPGGAFHHDPGLTPAKPADSDNDGVRDRKDQCPDTPAGAIVDAMGCPSDADGDGVYNGLDRCDATPKGARVDASGCPMDRDGDGVYDGLDRCDATPKGASVDASGCPSDSDGDGVWNGLDRCDATPKGAVVDATGCPKDSDRDGVWDGLDRCPDTPAGARVDRNGCPLTEKEQALVDRGVLELRGVRFQSGKSILDPSSNAALDEAGQTLLRWPDVRVEIAGHTDAQGDDAKNLALSQARAAAVREYLLAKFPGIGADRLTAQGYGETKPVADNASADGRAKNRRVEFVVLNPEVLK